MDHAGRLKLVAKVSYYVGWIALICGGLFHVNIARGLFMAVNLPQRNLFELGVACFVICIASELRAHTPAA